MTRAPAGLLTRLYCRLRGHDWRHSRDWRACERCGRLVAKPTTDDVSVDRDRVRGRP